MKEIGIWGEKLVGRWLQIQDYELLQQNWRCRWGEIDLIAQERVSKAIAFVEVKTRSKNNWDENGLLAIDSAKQEKIIKTASLFLAKYPQLAELPCRFDVALVSYQKCLALRGQTPRRRQAQTKALDARNADLAEGAKERKKIDVKEIARLTIGQAVDIEQWQVTIENYLQSAFDLS
ncbi:YraN family protein [Pleurocapsa sp. FMAR1]|uniref:YraN family protein n=1 Tax=Pleurocapsa sp. FMAR1 TaxID=3040204 RepID=UPI0029C7B966|nr:YraN family protein [Pleurocapsa sp. FMAR1]